MKMPNHVFFNPDFSQVLQRNLEDVHGYKAHAEQATAGILVNMLRRLFKCNAGDMNICEVAEESL